MGDAVQIDPNIRFASETIAEAIRDGFETIANRIAATETPRPRDIMEADSDGTGYDGPWNLAMALAGLSIPVQNIQNRLEDGDQMKEVADGLYEIASALRGKTEDDDA